MSIFEDGRREVELWGEAGVRMYEVEEWMLKSDFGRADPIRVHELARRAIGIPDDVKLVGGRPLADWIDDLD